VQQGSRQKLPFAVIFEFRSRIESDKIYSISQTIKSLINQGLIGQNMSWTRSIERSFHLMPKAGPLLACQPGRCLMTFALIDSWHELGIFSDIFVFFDFLGTHFALEMKSRLLESFIAKGSFFYSMVDVYYYTI
jgi:hypothetical protein